MSLQLLDQSMFWRSYANYVSVAYVRRNSHSSVRYFLTRSGIGAITVAFDKWREELGELRIEVNPRFNRRILGDLKGRLYEEQKTFCEAGSQHGRWSPFKSTCQEILEYVQKNEGCAMKDMMSKIRHHYASDETARSSLRRWMLEGKVPGVRMEKEGRYLRLYLSDKEKP